MIPPSSDAIPAVLLKCIASASRKPLTMQVYRIYLLRHEPLQLPPAYVSIVGPQPRAPAPDLPRGGRAPWDARRMEARRKDDFYIRQHSKLVRRPDFPSDTGLILKFKPVSQRYYMFIIQPQHRSTIEAAVRELLSTVWDEPFRSFKRSPSASSAFTPWQVT